MTLSDQTKAEAAAWLSRLHMDTRDPADEAAFRTWLAASRDNARAFEAVSNVWETTGGLRSAVAPSVQGRVSRRSALVAGGALITAGTGFGTWEFAYAGVYETDVGEQRHVSLSDDTQVFLDTDTKIREIYSTDIRKLALDRGRINVRVKPDPARPFVVESGEQRILAPATSFDVRRDADLTSVILLRGEATVLPSGLTRNKALHLRPGQRLTLSTAAVAHVDEPNLAPLTAWQTGQAIFENETLADATAEMNRYTTERITINDPKVASFRISGVYRVGDNEAFVRSLARVLPVAIEHYPGRIELVSGVPEPDG